MADENRRQEITRFLNAKDNLKNQAQASMPVGHRPAVVYPTASSEAPCMTAQQWPHS